MNKRTFVKNTAVMTATSLLLRTLGIVFRIFISNRVGAEGMGLYQLVFSVCAGGSLRRHRADNRRHAHGGGTADLEGRRRTEPGDAHGHGGLSAGRRRIRRAAVCRCPPHRQLDRGHPGRTGGGDQWYRTALHRAVQLL